jgi:hypothetical protein
MLHGESADLEVPQHDYGVDMSLNLDLSRRPLDAALACSRVDRAKAKGVAIRSFDIVVSKVWPVFHVLLPEWSIKGTLGDATHRLLA